MSRTGVPREILLVEDDPYVLAKLTMKLTRPPLKVIAARTIAEALRTLTSRHQRVAAVVMDLHLSYGEDGEKALRAYAKDQSNAETLREYTKEMPIGVFLAQLIREKHPTLPIYGMTSHMADVPDSCREWFEENGDGEHSLGVYDKTRQWALLRHRIFRQNKCKTSARVFITHGHNKEWLQRLTDYARKLGLVPRTLGECAAMNNAWIEGLEREARGADVAWILCTEDEGVVPFKLNAALERRPRPNVLTELGYFLGEYWRKSGRIYIFQRDNPSMGTNFDGVERIFLEDDDDTNLRKIREKMAPWLLDPA